MAKRTGERRWAVLLHHVSVRLVAFAALAGLFAMHGLSADHMLNSSGAWASMTMSVDSSSPTTHAGSSPTSVPHQEASRQEHPAMTMGGCVAALPSQTTLSQPCPLATAALPPPLRCSAYLPPLTAAARAPPQPTVIRLCISRT
jgi:hypothetical protein